MLLALLGGWPGQLGDFRHLETDFFFDDFQQRDISRSHVTRIGHQWAAQGARTGIELAHTARNQINQNVGIANLLQCLPCQFRVQSVSKVFHNF